MAISLGSLKVFLKTDDSDFKRGLDQAESTSKSWAGRIGGYLGDSFKFALGGLMAQGINAISNSFSGLVKGMIDGNAEFERYQTQFGVLLGSADAAKARLEDLAEFGRTTPFDLPEVVQADKILQGFGLHAEDAAKRFGYSGEEIRRIAGDVAAGAGVAFTDMSTYLGKFSSGATGEAIARFQELGIVTRKQLADMGLQFSKSGELLSPIDEAMGVILASMQDKYGGMMDAQSKTFDGMISNLRDWAGQTMRILGQPIFDIAKKKLGSLLEFLGSSTVQNGVARLAAGLGRLSEGIVSVIESLSARRDFGILERITPIFSAVGARVREAYSWAQSYIPPILNASVKLFDRVAKGAGEIANNVLPWLTSKLYRLGTWFTQNGPLIKTFAITLIEFLGSAFTLVASAISEAWTIIEPILDGLLDIVLLTAETVMALVTGDWQKAWDSFSQIPQIAIDALWKAIDPIGETISTKLGFNWETTKATWGMNWAELVRIVKDAAQPILLKADEIVTGIENRLPFLKFSNWIDEGQIVNPIADMFTRAKEKAVAALEEMRTDSILRMAAFVESLGLNWNEMSARWSKIFDDLVLIGGAVIDKMGKVAVQITDAIINAFIGAGPQTGSAFGAIVESITSAWNSVTAFLRTNSVTAPIIDGINSAIQAVNGAIVGFFDVGKNIIQGINDGIASALGGLIESITGAMEGAIKAAKKSLQIESPSLMFANLGKLSMEGFALGINQSAALPQQQMTQAITKLSSAATALVGRGTQQPVTLGGAMTWAPTYNIAGAGAAQWANAQIRREQLTTMRKRL